ncbi:formylglycine-generating enzyme family protein [Shivajiella indica]|uniref:Formylglycine-generating enzyme family protein n=1 Tax=Shivajiella indica TaxID=872115 RepID=A0ABW5B9Z9_9BACT
MDKKEAFVLLQVPEHASAEEIKRSFESLYEATKQRLEHAPLENQKQLYRKRMSQYWQAYASLVDIGKPEYVSKFSGEEMSKKSTPEMKMTGKSGQFFQSEPKPEKKKGLSEMPWKPIAAAALIGLGIFIAWKIIFAIPAPVKELMAQMEYISGGTFEMGCTREQRGKCADNELPGHAVTLSSFQIGKFEVTRAQWYAVMKYYPKAGSPCNQTNCPIVQVSWEEVHLFLQKLNKMTGQSFRLPTEAEWEYASRGGNESRNTIFAGSNQFNQVARLANAPYPVGSLAANEKQLFNMSGNVWEWCQDGFDANYYKNSPKANPQGQSAASCKVIRGGSFKSKENSMRVSSRNCLDKNQHSEEVGFRLAITFSR